MKKIGKHLKSVLLLKSIEGPYREQVVEVLAGDSTETIFVENGCKFSIDLSKLMFCLTNFYSKKRILELVKPYETVIDLCAGIGQYSIPIAKLNPPAKIYAIEVNLIAYNYLVKNIFLNKVGDVLFPIFGNSLEICKEMGKLGDRVLIGYLRGSKKFLGVVNDIAKARCWVHFHDVYSERELPDKPLYEIKSALAKFGKIEIINMLPVKSFAPGIFHIETIFKFERKS
jgi:tRNA wybutosine-synthesizing protein 2